MDIYSFLIQVLNSVQYGLLLFLVSALLLTACARAVAAVRPREPLVVAR